MARYICRNCESISYNWKGRCSECGSWGTFDECAAKPTPPPKIGALPEVEYFCRDPAAEVRLPTKIEELDRVLGGGLVRGSAVLVGGEPGIGKSTLIMQLAAKFENKTLYVSGEESVGQISLRAQRMGLVDKKIKITTDAKLENILALVDSLGNSLQLVVIDSVQTIHSEEVNATAGSVNQLRHCVQALISQLKAKGIASILVGHVTKSGQIAGPKLLEHMVDTVLYFEDDEKNHYRLIRAVKNRFGNVDEVGIFEMVSEGLKPVANPSSVFLNKDGEAGLIGTAVTTALTGSRPIMVETHALITNSYAASPRRSVLGWDLNRLSMLIAVLSTHCKLNIANKEVYLNIAGGLKIQEPALDLAVAAALISAYHEIPLQNPRPVIIGEVTLSGEIKNVSKIGLRIKEARHLGFHHFITPRYERNKEIDSSGIAQLGNIRELLDLLVKNQCRQLNPT